VVKVGLYPPPIIPPNKIIILLDSKKIYTSGIYYNIQLGNCTWMGLE